jgi:Homeodomain-like domain
MYFNFVILGVECVCVRVSESQPLEGDKFEKNSVPKSAPKPVRLIEGERQQLQKLVNRHTTPQQISLRASIILLADDGLNNREIARTLNISRDMARMWRERWLEGKNIPISERLQDLERSGSPATFSLEQITQKLLHQACQIGTSVYQELQELSKF